MSDWNANEPCKVLSWDSAFWGFPIAQVHGNTLTTEHAAAIDRWCSERSIACLYFLASFDDPVTIRTAEDAGYQLVDARVTAIVETKRTGTLSRGDEAGVRIRPVTTQDIGALQSMARDSYTTSRFYFDRRFPRAKCGELYEHWIAADCQGAADVVLVAEIANEPVGYITCHLPTETAPARMGLINVAAHARRRGVGRALLFHAFAWYAEQGVSEAVGITQARNLPVQALNERCGFVTKNFQLWYHKWYRLPDSGSS